MYVELLGTHSAGSKALLLLFEEAPTAKSKSSKSILFANFNFLADGNDHAPLLCASYKATT